MHSKDSTIVCSAKCANMRLSNFFIKWAFCSKVDMLVLLFQDNISCDS